MMQDQQILYTAESDRFSLRNYLGKYIAYKWLYLGALFLCVCIAWFYIAIKVPLYRIQASIVIKDEKKGEANSITLKELDFLDEQKIVDNEAEIVKSESVISAVVEEQQLNISLFLKKKSLRKQPLYTDSIINIYALAPAKMIIPVSAVLTILDTLQYSVEFNKEQLSFRFGDTVEIANSIYVINKGPAIENFVSEEITMQIVSSDEATQNIRKGIVISTPTKNSSILNISMLHPSPQRGSMIVASILNKYSEANAFEKKVQIDTILKLIEGRIALISRQLEQYEKKEEVFKSGRRITQLSDDSRMFLERAKENDKNLSEAKLQLEMIGALQQFVNSSRSVIAPPQGSISDPALLSMINQLSQLELEKESLLKTTGEKNPMVELKKSQLQNIRMAINQNLQLQKSNLERSVASLQLLKLGIDRNISTVPDNEKQLTEIIREKNIRESVYVYLLQKREEASITNASAFSKMRIIDNPYSTANPVKPNKMIVFMLASLAGFIAVTILINLKEALRNKVSDRQQLESRIPANVIGEIPSINPFTYTVFEDADILVQEQFRKIRTRLLRSFSNDSSAKIILVTSSAEKEGKAFTAISLASSFALLNKPTLLMYSDNHNSLLSGIFSNYRPESPLTITQNGQVVSAERFYQHPSYPLLKILSSSWLNEEESELSVLNPKVFFENLKKRFDYIILLLPPAKLFTEALEKEAYSDATLFVVRHSFTSLSNIDYLAKAIGQKDFTNLMVVYNDVPVKRM